MLRFDLSTEGLVYYFPVPHNKSFGSEVTPILCCFRGPENVGVIPLNGAQPAPYGSGNPAVAQAETRIQSWRFRESLFWCAA